jgi:hypothetical protein
MMAERIGGTFERTVNKMFNGKQWLCRRHRNIGVFMDGHFYSGRESSHLTTTGRRLSKLRRLQQS